MKEIILKNNGQSLNLIEAFVEDICDGVNISNTFLGNILIAISEIVGIIESQNSSVKISFYKKNKKFIFEFSEFDRNINLGILMENENLKLENPELENSLFMINALCDDVKLDEKQHKIILEFVNAGVDEVISLHRKKYLSKYLNQRIKV